MDYLLRHGFNLECQFDIIHESEVDILKKNILELKEQLANSDDKYKNMLENLGGITNYINKQTERLDRYHFYCESLKKNIKDLSDTITKNKLEYEEKIKKLEDNISLKSEKEHQVMQLCKILNRHSEIAKEEIRQIEKEENINKKRKN
jgi:chromosome segregation ATPase